MPGFSPNVICTYPSTQNSSEHVILSAHYDSRGSFGNTRAPGGDDDGSGSGHLLGVVEAMKRGGVQFKKKVQVAFFSGEEQGLFGSHAYAGGLLIARVDTSADIRIPAQDKPDCHPTHSG